MRYTSNHRYSSIFALVFVLPSLIYGSLFSQEPPDTEPPIINHIPVQSVVEGESIAIEADIFDRETAVSNARLYFRSSGEQSYEFEDMNWSVGNYVATIPAKFAQFPGIEYYIIAADRAANVASFPERSPRTNPVFVQVIAKPVQAQPTLVDLDPPVISHTALVASPPNQEITIVAGATDAQSKIDRVILHYKNSSEIVFKTTGMTFGNGRYSARIPAKDATSGEIEYYISARDGASNTATLPLINPSQEPFRITISEAAPPVVLPGPAPEEEAVEITPAGPGAPDILILTPEPGEEVTFGEVVVAASFFDEQNDIDITSIKLFVDGSDVSARAQVTADLLTYVPDPFLTSGKHSITIVASDLAGNAAAPTNVEFSVSARAISAAPVIRISGSTILDSKFDNIIGPGAALRQEPEQTNSVNLNLSGSNDWLDFDGKFYVTSEETPFSQPRNRYRLDFRTKYVGLKVGDVDPYLSQLMLWGRRVRGIEGLIKLGVFNLDIVYGQILRDVEGVAVPSSTGGDSTVVFGTFDRNVFGIRPHLGTGRRFQWGISLVRVRDDTTSIAFGSRPKDNAVIGSDFLAAFANRRVIVDGNVALSIFTDDISGGPLTKKELEEDFGIDNVPIDPEDFEDLIIINASTLPLDPSNLSSLAYDIGLKSNLYRHAFEFRFRSIGAVYTSLANNTLLNDRRGFRLRDSFRMMQNRVLLSLGYEYFRDNLSKDKSFTRHTNIFSSNLSYAPQRPLPNINLGFQHYSRSGEALDPTTTAEGSSGDTDDDTNTYIAGIRFPIEHDKINQQVGVNFTRIVREDVFNVQALSENDNFSINWQATFPSRPLILRFSYGFFQTENPGIFPDPRNRIRFEEFAFNNFTAFASYLFFKDRMKLFFNWRSILGSGLSSDGEINTDKLFFDVGSEFRFTPTQFLTLSVGLIEFNDDTQFASGGSDYQENIVRFRYGQQF